MDARELSRGDENISMQHAEGGGGSSGGIKNRGSVDGATGSALVTGSGSWREAATGAERQMANANGGRRGERELSHERRE